MTLYPHEEKRQFVRIRIETLVHFTIVGQSEPVYFGTSQNLSANGLYMTTEQKLKTGEEIEIVMNSEGQTIPPFVAHGLIKRCEADTENPKLYHVSVELTETQ